MSPNVDVDTIDCVPVAVLHNSGWKFHGLVSAGSFSVRAVTMEMGESSLRPCHGDFVTRRKARANLRYCGPCSAGFTWTVCVKRQPWECGGVTEGSN